MCGGHGIFHVNDVFTDAVSPHVGHQSVLPRVSPGMVHGANIGVHTPEALTRFRVVRTTFHRTLRSAQRSFWSHSQDCVASSLATPAVPFPLFGARNSDVSRGDLSARVRFASDPDRAPPQQEILDGWRTRFSTVGLRGSTFHEVFFPVCLDPN